MAYYVKYKESTEDLANGFSLEVNQKGPRIKMKINFLNIFSCVPLVNFESPQIVQSIDSYHKIKNQIVVRKKSLRKYF